jgi:hypothetical protein
VESNEVILEQFIDFKTACDFLRKEVFASYSERVLRAHESN